MNRDQILKALNISVVRIDPELWKMLESDQDKLDYINEIFTPDNQTPKLFPKSIEHSLFTSWIDPTKVLSFCLYFIFAELKLGLEQQLI